MVTLRTAFAQSYNTPAIRLFEKTGAETSFKYMDAFDFKKVSKKDHHTSSAIGGFEYGMSPLNSQMPILPSVTETISQRVPLQKSPTKKVKSFTNGKTAPRRFGTNAP